MIKYFVDVYIEDLYFSEQNQECPISILQWQSWANTWLNLLETDLEINKNYEFSLILCDDDYIQQLNAEFRHQNKPTDVLAFAALETDFPTPDLIDSISLGDIIISVETAQKQADEQQHSLDFELAWLAVHGFLHLLGWDHPDEKSLNEMLEMQKILLKEINIISIST
jgi:probable rRNA maturation factor